jgi:hypothetical protein
MEADLRALSICLALSYQQPTNRQKHEGEEESENHAEFGRLAGNTLSYGQTVQVRSFAQAHRVSAHRQGRDL